MIEGLTISTHEAQPGGGDPIIGVYFSGICIFSSTSHELIMGFVKWFIENYLQWVRDNINIFQAIHEKLSQSPYDGKVEIHEELQNKVKSGSGRPHLRM